MDPNDLFFDSPPPWWLMDDDAGDDDNDDNDDDDENESGCSCSSITTIDLGTGKHASARSVRSSRRTKARRRYA
ncbi:unnamed protein product [Calypogeia fissa]